MQYNFDEVIDRSGTDALKVEAIPVRWGRNDLIPMWVADMDFRTAPFIIEEVRKRCDQEIFGYTVQPERYFTSIENWIYKRYNWKINKDMIQFSPGVVSGFAYAIQCFTKPGDKILIQTPVYYPFFTYTEKNDRIPVYNPLILENGQYRMNMDQFRELAKECKLFMFCHPQNPGGRIWNEEELKEIAEICDENNVLVVSDEIHADLALPGYTHIPFATVSEKAANNSITFMAASKAFNIPGLASAYAIISNPELKEQFTHHLSQCEAESGHIFAYTPVAAAYEQGTEWLKQVTEYIAGNINYLDTFLQENTSLIKVICPQSSYLVFLDCRALNLSQKELVDFFIDGAHLALNDGSTFGQEGIGFMRMNVGCPRSILQKALNNLKIAYDKRFIEK